MSEQIVNIDEANAQRYLVEESFKRPVVVDFWADWCEPCKVLMPLLEKLAAEYQGQFLLAKVNADQQQGLAQQMGVRSLPTVMVIKDGRPVDGFAGAQPETKIREILDKYLPKPWDNLLQQAQELIGAGEQTEALPLLRRAYDESARRHDITLVLARLLLELKRLDEAGKVLAEVRKTDQDAEWEQLQAQLKLKQDAGKSPEIEALENKLTDDEDNFEIRQQLAVQYNQAGRHKDAMELLIFILRKDLQHGEGATRNILLDIIAALGKGDPLAVEYQRKLFGLMY